VIMDIEAGSVGDVDADTRRKKCARREFYSIYSAMLGQGPSQPNNRSGMPENLRQGGCLLFPFRWYDALAYALIILTPCFPRNIILR